MNAAYLMYMAAGGAELDAGASGPGLEVLSVALGALLLLVALLGRVTVKELKVGTTSRTIRILSGFIGCAFIVLGFVIGGVFGADGTDANTVPPPPPKPTSIVLGVSLGAHEGEKETATELRIFLGGEEKAQISLPAGSSSFLSLPVTVPKPGEYSYHIAGYTRWTTDPNRSIPVVGNGKVMISEGASYSVFSKSIPTAATQQWEVFLGREPED